MATLKDRLGDALNAERDTAKLTPRQTRFVQELIQNPINLEDAAVKAGYAISGARAVASRLMKKPSIQHALAQHFLDKEEMISNTLTHALLRLQSLIVEGTNKEFIPAAKLLLGYTKLATGVLGLQVSPKEAEKREVAESTVEELILEHERELQRLQQLLASRPEVTAN